MLFLTPQSMASQTADVESSYVEIASFVRGYHDYQAVSQPSVGKVLLLQTEPTNIKDNKVVTIVKNTSVTGAVVNRGAGYGMEVPCKYRLYGTRAYVEHVQKIISLIIHVNKLT